MFFQNAAVNKLSTPGDCSLLERTSNLGNEKSQEQRKGKERGERERGRQRERERNGGDREREREKIKKQIFSIFLIVSLIVLIAK